jgi:hypothetical protein
MDNHFKVNEGFFKAGGEGFVGLQARFACREDSFPCSLPPK